MKYALLKKDYSIGIIGEDIITHCVVIYDNKGNHEYITKEDLNNEVILISESEMTIIAMREALIQHLREMIEILSRKEG